MNFLSVFEELDRVFDRDARMEMIEEQLISRGIKMEKLINSMLDIPRHRFMPSKFTFQAYDDQPIPLGYHRVTYPPGIVAMMIESADIQPTERVLEVGTGCGYTTALLSRFSPQQLISIDEVEEFIEESLYRLQHFGLRPGESFSILGSNDLTEGFAEAAPYDAIIVNPPVFRAPPRSLFEQLAYNGRLIAPVMKDDGIETLCRYTRLENDAWVEEVIFEQRNPSHISSADPSSDFLPTEATDGHDDDDEEKMMN